MRGTALRSHRKEGGSTSDSGEQGGGSTLDMRGVAPLIRDKKGGYHLQYERGSTLES